MEKKKYYRLDRILKENAIYNMIIGERSNGKTYAVDDKALLDYCEHGWQLGIIRRYADDFTGKRGQQMFDALVANGLVEKYSKGKWTGITYRSSRWYLSRIDKELNTRIMDDTPFAYGFSLSTVEHDKSTSYPFIKNILFDEFLTRQSYLPDEFVLFMNTLSTIIRDREDVKIFMCGNTVNKFSPYFKEMGITNIEKMQKGSIDVYTYGNSELKVAVEYTDSISKTGKKSDKYFAFNNPKLNMITTGAWEIAMYPHLPYKYKQKDIMFTYFIVFEKNILQCEVIGVNNDLFTYIHRKTSPLKDEDNDIIFSQGYSSKPNQYRKVTHAVDKATKKISYFYKIDKVFYQDNEIGEIMRNYLQWCNSDRGVLN